MFEQCVKALAVHGRIVVIGAMSQCECCWGPLPGGVVLLAPIVSLDAAMGAVPGLLLIPGMSSDPDHTRHQSLAEPSALLRG